MGKILGKIYYWKKKEKLEEIPKTLWDIEVEVLDLKNGTENRKIKMEELKGEYKAFLIVNISDACNMTSMNFRSLTKLHRELETLGLKVIAVPCLQFDKKKKELIACEMRAEDAFRSRFKVEFTCLKSMEINGPRTHALYKYLRANTPQLQPDEDDETEFKPVPYNFAKFILDRDANIYAYLTPLDKLKDLRQKVLELIKRGSK